MSRLIHWQQVRGSPGNNNYYLLPRVNLMLVGINACVCHFFAIELERGINTAIGNINHALQYQLVSLGVIYSIKIGKEVDYFICECM